MAARLHRVAPGVDPGFCRRRTAQGFTYTGPDGDPPDADDQRRIDALVLPPAWTDVWISVDPDGHIQATGLDADGREQYRYHQRWEADRADAKFDRILHLAAALPLARGRSTRAINDGGDRERILGAAFRILDDGAPRVGSIEYLEKYGSRGLTTMRRGDASVDKQVVTLSFPAKEHSHDVLHLHDELLAEVVTGLSRGNPDVVLLSYDADAGRQELDPREVNDYIRSITGGQFSAKDFRTIRGTTVAAESLARTGTLPTERQRKKAEVEAVRAAAEALCNTPAVARSSYIDPRVFKAYADGRVLELGRSPDAALLELIPLETD